MAQFQPVNLMRMKYPKPAVLPHGLGHQTPAVRHAHSLALGLKLPGTKRRKSRSPSGTRKKKAHKISAAPARRKRKTRTTAASFVKGSAAAKKHMASLRAMRGKKRASASA